MNVKKTALVTVLPVLLLMVFLWRSPKPQTNATSRSGGTATDSVAATGAVEQSGPLSAAPRRPRVKHRALELSTTQKAEFEAAFQKRYKPAITKWCAAFAGHIPFAPEEVTAEKFVERVGLAPAYSEYIFVVNGITLGVQDTKGVVQVDYLNAPDQTRKMATLPNSGQAPTVTTPVTRREIANMLNALGTEQFSAEEIRLTPSGLSGSLNGGVMANAGGTPENGASWKYDIVFGPDGKLAYFLKGNL